MDDKYIITNNQQGQPQNHNSAVGPSNVATSDTETDDLIQKGPESIPQHPHKVQVPKKPGAGIAETPGTMKSKIGKT